MGKIKTLLRWLTYPWRRFQTNKWWNKNTPPKGYIISTPEDYYKKLVEEMLILFEYDNYEEVCYPIIKTYLLYRSGKLEKISEDEKQELSKASHILGIPEEL